MSERATKSQDNFAGLKRASRRAYRRNRPFLRPQTPACDKCSQGVMDSTNSHWLGTCQCECHKAGGAV